MKKMKWLRKLPILLFALILAVSSLMMAVPTRAEVLTGSAGYYTFPAEDWNVKITTDLNYGSFYVLLLPGSYVLITSNGIWFSCGYADGVATVYVQSISGNPDNLFVSCSEVMGVPPSVGSDWVIDFTDFDTDVYSGSDFDGLKLVFENCYGVVLLILVLFLLD